MGIIRNRLARRFSTLGLVSDLALVGAAANRLIQRRGSSGARSSGSATEMMLAGGAALRLLQRLRRRRKIRKASA